MNVSAASLARVMDHKLTFGNVDSMSSEASTLPDQRTLLRQQSRNFSAHQLVRDGLVTVRVQLVLVCQVPSSRSRSVVVGNRFFDSRVLRLLGKEGIPVWVLFAADITCTWRSVDLEDGVVRTIDVRVDP